MIINIATKKILRIFTFVFYFGVCVSAQQVKFVLEGLKHPRQVGAIFECSHWTGQELMRYAQKISSPRRVIELGAGMGSITQVIVENLRPEQKDELDVIEINPEYCTHLRALFPKDKFPHIHIHCADVLEFVAEKPYDAIICTLPFNLFDSGLIARMQNKIKQLIKPGFYVSYVEYAAFKRVGSVLNKLRSDRTQTICKQRNILIDGFKQKYLIESVFVMRNMFPLYVHHLKIN